MQEIEAIQQARPLLLRRPRLTGRWIFLVAAASLLLLLGLVPPLVSVNRYQHRISTSIGASLGRPVHFDQVSLNLIPVPSFTITDFVVEEDPDFGAEPIIRANTVKATLRVSSLWRRRVEFSRISFFEPSLNLVHDHTGRWNVEGILFQAAQIQTAPTGQRSAGSTPRFPYIEATGARLNLKQGLEKTPFSLAETDFALWQPEPRQWKMRIQGRPMRTDTSVSDTGILQAEGIFGRAASLESVPLDFEATWRGAPLGEASRLFLSRDLGLRGQVTVTASVRGSGTRNAVQTHVQLDGVRRSDFVPDKSVSLQVNCSATATRVFHSAADVRCSWPVPDSDGAMLALAGSVPDVLSPRSADLQIGISRLPSRVLLNWLRVGSARIPSDLRATGLVSGSIAHTPDASAWVGQTTISDLALSGANIGPTPFSLGSVFLHSLQPESELKHTWSNSQPSSPAIMLSPVPLDLGGREQAVLEGTADGAGYTLHLTGVAVPSRLAAFGDALPQFGDGLSALLSSYDPSAPVRLDLSAQRSWADGQTWVDNLAPGHPAPAHSPRHSGRRSRS